LGGEGMVHAERSWRVQPATGCVEVVKVRDGFDFDFQREHEGRARSAAESTSIIGKEAWGDCAAFAKFGRRNASTLGRDAGVLLSGGKPKPTRGNAGCGPIAGYDGTRFRKHNKKTAVVRFGSAHGGLWVWSATVTR
jgi:hypothetical protein